jgi:hypothetical protein
MTAPDNRQGQPMNDTDLNELERIARKATKGRWRKDAPTWATPWMVGIDLPFTEEEPVREVICTLDVQYGNTEDAPRALDLHYDQVIADAAYIAAARPEIVLKLIEEIRTLRCRLRAPSN